MTDKRPGICYLRSNLESKKAKKELEGSTTNSTKFEITGTTQGEQKTAKRATKARPIGRLGTTYPYTPSSYRVSLRLSQIVNPGEKEIDLFHSLALFVVFLRFLFAPKKLPTCEGVKRVFFFVSARTHSVKRWLIPISRHLEKIVLRMSEIGREREQKEQNKHEFPDILALFSLAAVSEHCRAFLNKIWPKIDLENARTPWKYVFETQEIVPFLLCLEFQRHEKISDGK